MSRVPLGTTAECPFLPRLITGRELDFQGLCESAGLFAFEQFFQIRTIGTLLSDSGAPNRLIAQLRCRGMNCAHVPSWISNAPTCCDGSAVCAGELVLQSYAP